MELILLEKIRRLGNTGDIVNVKDGYGRNYLIPRKKALRATNHNKEIFEHRRQEIELLNQEKLEEAKSILANIDGLNVNIIKQASEDGKLYGSVTASDIAAELKEISKHNILAEQVELNEKYKGVGVYVINIHLHPDVIAKVNLNIARSRKEAELALAAEKEQE